MKNHNEEQLSFSIINTTMTVEAMRSSGYKSTTHALAELVDNSIEANALDIEIFGVSRRDKNTGRMSLQELAVLDNGDGMDLTTLRGSLRYGKGTRQERKGIGRFGLGLPNSSMSQSRRVDIWSWQNGHTNALHTYLSIDEVAQGQLVIPIPELKPIPGTYHSTSIAGFKDSGTLVVWSDLDMVEWQQATTTFKHTEFLLGRIYRRFLCEPSQRLSDKDSRNNEIGGRRKITCIPVEEVNSSPKRLESIVEVRPNDPLYLMGGTMCPEKFGDGPMFVELESSPFIVNIIHNGEKHDVIVRASYARPHVRDSSHPDAEWPEEYMGMDAGHTDWGKDAARNMGISLMRSHREIEIDQSWVSGDDPRERWWTVEVDFPTALDEIFGVTNTKQGSMTFQRLARYDWKRDALPDENSSFDVKKRMEEDGDPRVHLLDLNQQIRKAIKIMRDRVRQTRQSRTRHSIEKEQKTDAKATVAIKRRIQEGYRGESDRAAEFVPENEQKTLQMKSLVEKYHLDESDALQRVIQTIETKYKVRWLQSDQSTPAFFDVDSLPDVIQVALNTNHPVYSDLYAIMHPDTDEMSTEEIRERLEKAAMAFRLLIYAWARFEDEQDSERLKDRIMEFRIDWGKMAKDFFYEDDESPYPSDLV